jgi:hypothetical protein
MPVSVFLLKEWLNWLILGQQTKIFLRKRLYMGEFFINCLTKGRICGNLNVELGSGLAKSPLFSCIAIYSRCMKMSFQLPDEV